MLSMRPLAYALYSEAPFEKTTLAVNMNGESNSWRWLEQGQEEKGTRGGCVESER